MQLNTGVDNLYLYIDLQIYPLKAINNNPVVDKKIFPLTAVKTSIAYFIRPLILTNSWIMLFLSV